MRDPEKQLGTANLLIGMFKVKLETHEAEDRCDHADEVATLRAGLETQQARAAELQRELDGRAEVAAAFDVTGSPRDDTATPECREGQHHACRPGWAGCTCSCHGAPS